MSSLEVLSEVLFEMPSEFRLSEQSEFTKSLGMSNSTSLELLCAVEPVQGIYFECWSGSLIL